MIRLDLTSRPLARLALDAAPLAVIAMGVPAARLDLAPRPLGFLRLPVFPATLDEALGLAGVSGFLDGADGPLHGVDG